MKTITDSSRFQLKSRADINCKFSVTAIAIDFDLFAFHFPDFKVPWPNSNPLLHHV